MLTERRHFGGGNQTTQHGKLVMFLLFISSPSNRGNTIHFFSDANCNVEFYT